MNKAFTSEMLRGILDELSSEISYRIELLTEGSFVNDCDTSYIRIEWNDESFCYCPGRRISPGFIDVHIGSLLENRIKNKIKTKYGSFEDNEYNRAWLDLKVTLLTEERHKRESDPIISESESIINKSSE